MATLTCVSCTLTWERNKPGRPPKRCPDCRGKGKRAKRYAQDGMMFYGDSVSFYCWYGYHRLCERAAIDQCRCSHHEL